jgi:addiction module HigA family antidote
MRPGKLIPAPPVTPGEVLRTFLLSPRIRQEDLADAMEVSRFSVNQIVNGRRAVTAEMALRLARVLSTSPELWLNLQQSWDLYEARLNIAEGTEKLPVLRAPKSEADLYVDPAQDDGTWLSQVRDCVGQIDRPEFTLDDVYKFEREFSERHPKNRHVRDKIRQQLQILRDEGFLDFVEPGTYRLRSQK